MSRWAIRFSYLGKASFDTTWLWTGGYGRPDKNRFLEHLSVPSGMGPAHRPGSRVGLLQEAHPPPQRLSSRVQVESTPWITGQTSSRPWRTTVARLSDRVQVRRLPQGPLDSPDPETLGVSLEGTLAVADVTLLATEEVITMASMYGSWECPRGAKPWIYADASVHRLISDISALVSSQRGHRIIAAGDLNILKGYGEYGNRYWQREMRRSSTAWRPWA